MKSWQERGREQPAKYQGTHVMVLHATKIDFRQWSLLECIIASFMYRVLSRHSSNVNACHQDRLQTMAATQMQHRIIHISCAANCWRVEAELRLGKVYNTAHLKGKVRRPQMAYNTVGHPRQWMQFEAKGLQHCRAPQKMEVTQD